MRLKISTGTNWITSAFVVAVLLSATPCFGAISHVQQASFSDVSGTSYTSFRATFSSPTTSGNAIILGVTFGNTNPTITATDSQGNNYTQAIETYDSRHSQGAAIFYATNISAGPSNTVTLSFSAPVAYLALAIHEYSGVVTSSPLDVVSGSTGSGNSLSSGSVTTTANGDLIFGLAVEDAAGSADSFTAGSGFTKRVDRGDVAAYADEDQVQTSAGTIDGSWALAPSGLDWTADVAAFKAASGLTGPSITRLSPNAGPTGTSVTITGTNFGATQGASTVTFNGSTAAPTSWSATSIVVGVPSGATTGNVVVLVSGTASSGVSFTVGTGASIVQVQQASNSDVSSVSFSSFAATFTSATTTGNAIVVGLTFGNTNPTITAMDSQGNNYTQAIKTYDSGHSQGAAIFYAANITGGASNTVTLNFSAPVAWLALGIHEYSGVAVSSALDATSATIGLGTSLSSSSTITTANGELIFGVGVDDTSGSGDTLTAGTGFTKRVDLSLDTGYADEDQVQTLANPIAATWSASLSGQGWIADMATFKAAISGGGGSSGPTITSLSPISGAVGTAVTITGTGFGASQGPSTVTFHGTAATPTSWSATRIVAPVPNSTTTGNVVVTVGGVPSNGANFTVTTGGTPPSIGASVSPTPNANGWNNSGVTVTFTCTAGSSAITSCTSPQTISSEGANQVVSGTATDANGLTATTNVTLNIDLTPPVTAITSPTDGTVVTSANLNVTGTVSDALSGIADVTCNGLEATISGSGILCNLTLSVGSNAIQVQATDLGGNTGSATVNVTYNLTPPPVALFLTPDHLAIAMSETRTLALVDDLARAIPPSNWTVSDPTVAQIGPDGTITPLAGGNVTITASYQSLSATAQLTVYGSQTFPPATVRWTVQPLPGNTLLDVLPGQAAGPDDPDIYFAEQAGSNIVMRAMTSDGRQKWAHTILPTLGSGGARAPMSGSPSAMLKRVSAAQARSAMIRPHRWGKKITAFMNKMKERHKALMASDDLGAELRPARLDSSVRGGRLSLVSEHKKAFLRPVQSGGGSVDVTVLSAAVTDAGNQVVNTFESSSSGGCTNRVDNIIVLDTNGNELWRRSIPCGEMGFALHPDGIVYILQADYNNGTMILFAFDEFSGAQQFAITLPYSWGGTLLAFVGLPSVLPDGDLYLPVETASSPNSLDTLQLWKVATDGSYSTYPVATASQCFGPVIEPHEAIPDGQGGVLVTWDYFGGYTLCNGNQSAVPVAHLSAAGQVLGQQLLPLVVLRLESYFSDNDGDALLGAQHLYVTDGRQSAVGLNLTTSNIDLNWTAQCSSNGCPKVSLAGVSADDQLIVNQTGNSDGSSTLIAVTPSSNSCQTACVATSSIPNTTLVAFDLSGTVFSPTFETSIFSNQYFFVLPTQSAPSGAEIIGGAVTAPDTSIVPEPDPLPPWPEVAMSSTRRASPITIKLNFTGSKTPGDSRKFLNGEDTCSEDLGLKDCTTVSGFRLWNLEGNAKVYNDASNWTVAVSVRYRYRGFYRDSSNTLQPFSCTSPSQPDGPKPLFLQQVSGQKSIFYLDAPGPYVGISPSNPCFIGSSLIDSETDLLNFQVTFASKLTTYRKTVYYYVKIIVNSGGVLDFGNSSAGYGNLSLPF